MSSEVPAVSAPLEQLTFSFLQKPTSLYPHILPPLATTCQLTLYHSSTKVKLNFPDESSDRVSPWTERSRLMAVLDPEDETKSRVEVRPTMFVPVTEVAPDHVCASDIDDGSDAENRFEVEKLRDKRLRRYAVDSKFVKKYGHTSDIDDPWVQRYIMVSYRTLTHLYPFFHAHMCAVLVW